MIAKTVPSVPRIGIDFDTLEYLGIDAAVVEEAYEPKQNHIKPLEDWAYKMQDRSLTEKVAYLRHKRIEIDSVLAALNNNAIFWDLPINYKRFETRDYNRVIGIPEYVMPDCMLELIDIVREKSTKILKEERTTMEEKVFK